MAEYGSGNNETIITKYLNSHLENGIKQKNLDFTLNLIDEYVEIIEGLDNDEICLGQRGSRGKCQKH